MVHEHNVRAIKRQKIIAILKSNPTMANTWVAETIGTSMQTVEKIREELEGFGLIPVLTVLKRSDGRPTPRTYNNA